MSIIIKQKFDNLKSFILKNTHHISATVFIFGFFLDAFTLPSVTSNWAYFTGIIYAAIVGVLLLAREYIKSDKINLNLFGREERYYINIFSILTSFFMGSLISFVFIYYLRGADILSGLPILIFILFIMIANEKVDNRDRFLFDITVYSVCITFLLIFIIPVIFKSMGDFVFVSSLILAGLFLHFFVKFTVRINSSSITKLNFRGYNYVLSIPLIIFVMYFTNIIPAVPLTLRNYDIYNTVFVNTKNKENNYSYTKENKCIKNFNPFSSCYFVYDDLIQDSISFYNEIQAPINLNAKITHKWEYYNEISQKWTPRASVSYSISGGREDGYRGYTTISSISKGLYRVSVIVADKRILGSKKFEVR